MKNIGCDIELQGWFEWWSMLREATLTSGIGVRTAHSIPCMPIKDVLIDRALSCAPNAKQKKTTKTAQHKDPTLTFVFRMGFLECL